MKKLKRIMCGLLSLVLLCVTMDISINNVKAANSSIVVSSIPNQEYTGKKIEPKLKVTSGNKILTRNKDYTLTYKNNVNVGKAIVTVKGINNYSFRYTQNFNIVKTIKLTIKIGNKTKTYVLGTNKSYTLPKNNKELAKLDPWIISNYRYDKHVFNGFRLNGKKVTKISNSTAFTLNALNFKRRMEFYVKNLILNKGIFSFKFNNNKDKDLVDGVEIKYSINENLKKGVKTINLSKKDITNDTYTIKDSKKRFKIGYYYYFQIRYFYKIGSKKHFYHDVTHKALGYGVRKNRKC